MIGGLLIDKTGNWEVPFLGSMILMGIGVVLAFRMQPESKFGLGTSEPIVPPLAAAVPVRQR